MLILNKPVYCKCSRNILTVSNNLAERIEAFYRLLSVKVDAQELLHMVTTPPDIYMEEAGFTHVAEAPDSQNPGQLKLEVLSQLLNRILLFASGGSTYQDRVYITVVLRKLGIKNVAGFMKQMQSYFEKTDRIWQLTGKPLDYAADVKHQNKQGAGTHSGRENKQKRESLEGKGQGLPEEGILTLHQTIFTRLQTEQIYHEIQNIYRTYPAAFRRIAKEELQVYEQGRLAKRIQYNKLANRVLKDRLPVFYGSQNPYETAEGMQESGPEKTADYGLAAAVLTNLVQAVYEVRPQYRRQTGRIFLSLEHSFWHSADNTLARFRIACKEGNGVFYGSRETDSLVLQEVSIVEKLLRLEKDIMQAKADDSREKDVMQAKENDSREKDVVQAWENDSQVKDIKQVWENSSHKESILQGLREKGRKCRLMYRQQGRLIPEAVKAGEDLMKKTTSGRTEQKPQQKIQKQHTELAFKTKKSALRPTEKQLHHEGKPQQQGTEPGPKGEVQEQYHIKPEAEPPEANLHPGEPALRASEEEQHNRKQKQEPPEIRLHERERELGPSETELYHRKCASGLPEEEQYHIKPEAEPPEANLHPGEPALRASEEEQHNRKQKQEPPEIRLHERERELGPSETELYHRKCASGLPEEEQYHIKPEAEPPEANLHSGEPALRASEEEQHNRKQKQEPPEIRLHERERELGPSEIELYHRKCASGLPEEEQYHIKPAAEPPEANLHPGEPASGAPEKEQYDRKQKQEPPEIRLHHRERESGPSETELHQREHTSGLPETEQYQIERTSGPQETELHHRECASGLSETELYHREHTPESPEEEQYHIKPAAEPPETNLYPGEPAPGPPGTEQYHRKCASGLPEEEQYHIKPAAEPPEANLHPGEPASEKEQYDRKQKQEPSEIRLHYREREPEPSKTEQYQREYTSEPPEAELYHRERASESSEEEQYHIKPAAEPPEMILHQRERGTGPSETELYYREPVTEIPDTMLHHGEVSHRLQHRKTQRKVSKSDSGCQEEQDRQHEGAQIQYRQVTGKQSATEKSSGENTAMEQERQPKVFWQEHRNRTESAATEKRMREFQTMLAPETIKIFDTLREYGSNPEKLVQEGIVTRNPEKLLLLNLLQQKQDTGTQTETGAGEPRLLHKQPVSLRQEEYLEEIRIRSREMKRLAEEAEKAVQKRQSQSGVSEQETQRAIRRIAEQAEQKMKQQLGSISEQVYAALERKLESEQRRRGL